MMLLTHLANRHPFKVVFSIGWATIVLLVILFGSGTTS